MISPLLLSTIQSKEFTAMMDDFWAVACTESRREQWAAENVARQGFTFYLPKYLIYRKQKGQKLLTSEVLFPRYLFVRTSGQWRFLLSTFGVVDIVMQGGAPARLPDKIVSDLKSRQDSEGFVILPKKPRLSQGQMVRVTEGPFAGQTGIYEGTSASDRRQVLMNLLGGKVKVVIGQSNLVAA